MIIFLNDDRAYLSWVTHHRQGFVLDGLRKPKLSHFLVHRATCREIKISNSPRFHWTTGAKFKACSLDRGELESWAAEEGRTTVGHCVDCRPDNDEPASGSAHLTKLGGEILDYVLDAALIHLEHEYPPYRLTVSDIAACFGKTPGQISPPLHQLIENGFIAMPGKMSTGAAIPPKRFVLPTMLALRTLEAFRNESDSALQHELAKLDVS